MDADRLRAVIEPLLAPFDAELVDLEVAGSGGARTLRVSVDRPGGVDLDTIASISRAVSRALDDADPIAGRYTLEVSSPGVERPLRRPEHFRGAVGRTVTAKTHADVAGERRHEGELVGVDDDGIVLAVGAEERRLAFDEIEKARTVFAWGPSPKPGKAGGGGIRGRRKQARR